MLRSLYEPNNIKDKLQQRPVSFPLQIIVYNRDGMNCSMPCKSSTEQEAKQCRQDRTRCTTSESESLKRYMSSECLCNLLGTKKKRERERRRCSANQRDKEIKEMTDAQNQFI